MRLLLAAAESETSGPEAAVAIAGMVLFGFIMWLFLR